ncbi:bifunctional DNA primase/polymerase [Burkholderia vietnamiensis]|uniref:bifunctional DNA primase/polymerase n=1 Tax=Burkholderia vietnamiensis TaxID=60552 RepID=UPI001B9CDA09|nr:bifunctional DNA primase/polymerase [Burkholderia vietnamiensis]MBR8000346.1 bifunctional DNA primase/polymerase [Burkholderia vietnamiensis]
MSDITKGSYAAGLAARGFNVFPLKPWVGDGQKSDGKTPAISKWPHQSGRDAKRINAWWANGPDRNIAIHTNTHNGVHIFVLDVDDKPGKNGSAELAQLEAKYGKLPETLTTLTPSGGRHLWFYCPAPVGKSEGKLGPALDVRGYNGYVAAPGSTIGGKAYVFANPNTRIQQAPQWLYKIARDVGTKAEGTPVDNTPLDGVDAARAEARVVEYLNTAPIAVENRSGDLTTYKVAAKCKDLGATQDQALGLMLECWNDRCDPPWDADELAAKVAHAYKYGQEPAGVHAPEAVFTKSEQPEEVNSGAHPFEKLNSQFFYTLHGGQSAIGWETTDEDGLPTLEFLSVEAFNRKHAALTFQDGKRSVPLTEAWMGSPRRRSYDKVVFKPGKTVPSRFYNLWRGFAVEPKAGDWSLMRNHIRDVICSGDASVDRYVMGWLARMVQQPGEPGEVALVLRGREGVGKGTLAWAIKHLFGHHAKHLSQSKHLTGSFNSHLRAATFVFADEAFWSGDKQGRGALFALITEDKLMIEAKGRDAVAQDNCVHLMMASNHDWVVPASADSRRFCVLDVADSKRQDGRYFDALRQQLRQGGFAAMLHELLHYDLTAYDVRQIPQTHALADQKTASLEGPARWLHDRLYDAAIGMTEWKDEPLIVPQAETYGRYVEGAKTTREFKPADPRIFWKEMKRLLQDAEGKSVQDYRPRVNGDRERQKVFPPLKKARSAFETNIRASIDWGETDIFS